MTPDHAARQLDCASCRPLLDAFLIDELDAASAEALRAHLVRCPACAAELGGLTRLIEALAIAPVPQTSPDLDERILVAAIAARQRRHEHRYWLADLRMQVFRGAVRTTSTLAVTVIAVALIGATLVFAASNLLGQTSFLGTSGATVTPDVSPTMTSPTITPTPAAPKGTPAATDSVAPAATSAPTTAPTPKPTPRPTTAPTASPSPIVTPTASPSPIVTPTPTATATPVPTPTPSVGPSPTEKPHVTPPPSTPSPTPTPTASP